MSKIIKYNDIKINVHYIGPYELFQTNLRDILPFEYSDISNAENCCRVADTPNSYPEGPGFSF
jgi:hypothetical protein